MRGAALELLDAMYAQAGSLGESLLRQSCRLSVVTEQIAKGGRGTAEHPRDRTIRGFWPTRLLARLLEECMLNRRTVGLPDSVSDG
jgi:hypothetical protein